MTVYVIQSAEPPRFKIGYTSGDPRARLDALQTGSPVDLSIRAVWWGATQPEEQALHDRFINDRLRGEWFFQSQQILEWIATLPVGAELPFWTWLVAQEERDDPIGDLAGDATQSLRLYNHPNPACASRFRRPPIESSDFDVWLAHLVRCRACVEAKRELAVAFGEWGGARMLGAQP